MADSKLKLDIRRNKILEQLRADGKVSVSQLSTMLGATPVTIRTDLAALERDGYLVRIQGGAIQAQRTGGFLSGGREPGDRYSEEKRAIAQAVAGMIQDGDTVFLNSGTTTFQVARALKVRKNLIVVTNSLSVSMELGTVPTFKVLLLGGEINARYGFTYGGDTQQQLSQYQADWTILSVDSVSSKGGVTTHHAEEAVIDRMMICNGRRLIVAADSSKIGRAGFSRVCDSNSNVCLITDKGCEEEAVARLKERNVHVVQV